MVPLRRLIIKVVLSEKFFDKFINFSKSKNSSLTNNGSNESHYWGHNYHIIIIGLTPIKTCVVVSQVHSKKCSRSFLQMASNSIIRFVRLSEIYDIFLKSVSAWNVDTHC